MKVWVANVPAGEVEMFKRMHGGRLSQGDPQPTVFTVRKLKDMGIVGIYRDDNGSEPTS